MYPKENILTYFLLNVKSIFKAKTKLFFRLSNPVSEII